MLVTPMIELKFAKLSQDLQERDRGQALVESAL
jgi:hypothetical protein